MTITAKVIDQFREPRGPLGVIAGRIMSKRSSNRERSAWTVSLLDLQPGDRVLELGFGPGLGIEATLGHIVTGRVVGIDHSKTMLNMASRRLRHASAGVQPELRLAAAEDLPDDLGVFDKIFSCNVWLFWSDPVAVFQELRDHLSPTGTLAVTHLPRHGDANRATTLEAAEKISDQLTRGGFTHIRREMLELVPVPAVCVLATS